MTLFTLLPLVDVPPIQPRFDAPWMAGLQVLVSYVLGTAIVLVGSGTAATENANTVSQQLLINQAMRGESVHPADVALSAAVTLVLGAALLLVAVWLYQRDTIVIGR